MRAADPAGLNGCLALFALLAVMLPLPGCGRAPPAAGGSAPAPGVPRFRDVAGASGIRFPRTGEGTRGSAGRRPLTILEAAGSGCAFLDYDGDGWPDLFFAGRPRCALYRNLGNGRFDEVTAAVGLQRPGTWMGCCTGDYDNDGRVDLMATGFNTCALYQNDGGGRFRDVTRRAGIRGGGFQTSCAFGDVDGDGFLDLYVCRYLSFGPGDPQYCRAPHSDLMRTCGPDVYQPEFGVFYRNRRDGTFEDATRRSGLHNAHGKAWGAVFADYDNDGRTDLYVANDEMPGDLFHNLGGGRMENVGAASGTAYAQDGSVQGGMGVDFGDYDNDGRLDLVVTTFWMEPDGLYRNEGGSSFSFASTAAGLASGTRKRVGFGTAFLDADNDGWLDLFFLNGHVQDNQRDDPEQGLPERMQLFLNLGTGRFREVSADAGEPFSRAVVGRGAAFGDYDNDGRTDIAAVDLNGAALLLHNDGPPGSLRPVHWLTVRALTGAPSHDAVGARIMVEAGGVRQVRDVRTCGSVLSANDPRAHFGLGAAAAIDRLSVVWPDGVRQEQAAPRVDRIVTLRERR